ncbi:Uncharacterized protein SCF082_LOCUS39579 [Durusdinium trenchii]|uniref:Uncharacterized protein n=1 Tax=Durusdinium trenchii TaxID=1381693 RepID=A0ABP0Q563_9DINO
MPGLMGGPLGGPPLETMRDTMPPGARTPPQTGARTPVRGPVQGTPCRIMARGTTPPATPGGRSVRGPGGSTPRKYGGVTPPLLTPNHSAPYLGPVPDGMPQQFVEGEDDVIVDGRWVSKGLVYQQMMSAVQEGFYIPEPPVPSGPKVLPWLPSRTSPNKDFKMLTPEEFLEKLNGVCDAFQPLEPSPAAMIAHTRPGQALESPRAYQLAAAEGSLSRLVEEAMWSGPIRHMAICVMAQRVIMLADSIRDNPDTSPGGRELMVSLLSSVKQMCAANTGDITVSRSDKFSGRIVILFGSASCTPEDLLKCCEDRYREVDQHCILIAVTMSAEPAGSAQLGKTIAAAINAWGEAEAKFGPPGTAGGAGRPELLIHLFGTAGFGAWAKALKLWHEQSYYPDEKRLTGRMLALDKILKGVVLDSAPGDSGTTVLGAFPMVQGDAALLSVPQPHLGELEIAPAAQIERYLTECEIRQAQKVADHGVAPAPPARVLHLENSGHVAHRAGPTEAVLKNLQCLHIVLFIYNVVLTMAFVQGANRMSLCFSRLLVMCVTGGILEKRS